MRASRGRPALAATLALLAAVAWSCGGDDTPPGADAAADDAAAQEPRVGAPCSADSDCGEHLGQQLTCVTLNNGVTWTGGYCTLPCDKQGAKCPPKAACEQEPIFTALDGAHCFAQCTVDPDCRAGYWCATTSYVCYPRAQP